MIHNLPIRCPSCTASILVTMEIGGEDEVVVDNIALGYPSQPLQYQGEYTIGSDPQQGKPSNWTDEDKRD